MRIELLLVLIITLFAPIGALAMLKLPAIFSDNMVVQRGMKTPVWGQADPGEAITVTLGGQHATTVADAYGAWMAWLKPMDAASGRALVVSGAHDTLTFANVAIGEVWLCSGQSNMQFDLGSAVNGKAAIAGANFPQLRYSHGGAWVVSSPETADKFSAIGYLFGRNLQQSLNVPVGIICNAVGGTPAESWMSPEGLRQDPYVRDNVMAYWDKLVAQYPQQKAAWEAGLQAAGKDPANEAFGPDFVPFPPSAMYLQHVKPIVPYAIRGVVWYQGESNAWCYPLAEQYYHLLPALVRDWRRLWGEGDLPFLIVQLPDIELGYHAVWTGRVSPYPELSQWCLIQEAQQQAVAALPNSGLVVTLDLGDKHDIHPTSKEEVGQRLTLLARNMVYKEKVAASGPVYTGMRIEGATIRLRFTHTDGGLVTNDGEPVQGFAIAGDDQLFLPAQAKIDGDSVIVSSDQVAKPLAVRYAFFNHNSFNLFNKSGLPAGPFRTDNWPWNLPAKAPRQVQCARAPQPPALDGTLNDPLWAQCKPAGQFTLPYTYHPSAYPTEVRFAYDDDCLYVAYRCSEPAMGGIVAKVTARQDEQIWQDNIVELLLDPQNDKRHFERFIVNPNAAYLEGRGYSNSSDGPCFLTQSPPIPARDWTMKWQVPLTVKTARAPQAWTAELAIPWTSLGIAAPQPGAKMGVQMTRTHAIPTEESEFITTGRDTMSGTVLPTCKYYAVPERFAELVFE